MKQTRAGYVTSLIVAVICIAGAALVFANRQMILDQISVWQYQPSGEVASLAQRSGMGEKGKFYFYTSQPVLEGSTAFNKTCSRQEKSTAVLGCYNGQRIYIYDVQDRKLDGIREVTAAHEMLHAAYQRLDDEKKQTVNTLLEVEYNKLKADEKFAERMAFYDRTEPGERNNELHSIIGTEIGDIDPELESYYAGYFSDRHKTVSLYEKYAGVFLQLQAQSEALAAELAQLGDKIEQETAIYNGDISDFNQDVEAFKQRVDSGDFSSAGAYQAEREALLERGNTLDTRRAEINSDVDRYETLRRELQSVASQSDALNRSIDSSLAPAPSL